MLIESYDTRTPFGLSVLSSAQPFEITMALREIGWRACRVQFDPAASAWIATVIDWKVGGLSWRHRVAVLGQSR